MTLKPADLLAWRRAKLDELAAFAARDPLANGVRALAFDLSERLAASELTLADLSNAARSIADDAFRDRAERFKTRREPPAAAPRALVAAALAPLDGAPFETVASALAHTRAGVVFTAHPTFATDQALRAALAAYAHGDASALDTALASSSSHRPEGAVALAAEHDEACACLRRAQDAMRAYLDAIVRWLAERHPARWAEIELSPLSLATWVGYDLDGRTDIHWGRTFHFRLAEKAEQLGRYARALAAASAGADVAALTDRLQRSAALAARQAALFDADLDNPAAVVAAANALTEDHPDRLISLRPIMDAVRDATVRSDDQETQIALSVVRAEMAAYGLGLGRIHLRVNAAQVRSTLKSDLGLAPDQAFLDRTALDAAATRAAAAEPRRVNFASVFREKMTARRQFMLCQQMIKHVDADAPIRFLIAEVEAPATVMGAVYLARHYGVDHRVDVSPLFETPEAIERAGRFLERLFAEPAYRDYARARGRVAIQLGFSDSGRFMGQAPADMAIERVHILAARAMAKAGLSDLEAVVFNTHGESMGRGGYPGALKERFDHLATPWTRARFAREGVALNAEASFQGGDGFLHFETDALAQETVAAMFEWAFAPPPRDEADAFYADINYSWDVYRAVKAWQEALFADANYQTALGAFAPAFLYSTGSRRTRRPSSGGAPTPAEAARALRAIPHNAVLQQLAAPANVAGGLGRMAAREPERFDALVAGSPRMAALVRLAETARRLTSLSILRAYADLFDPSFWTVRARRVDDPDCAARYNEIAQFLEPTALHVALQRLANRLSTDRHQFDRAIGRRETETSMRGFGEELYLLHAIRMAAIMHGFSLAAGMPTFSSRHDVSRADLMRDAVAMRFSDVADRAASIFPVAADNEDAFSAIVEAADDESDARGYPEVHRMVAEPLRSVDALIKDVTAGVAHFYDAFG